MKDVTIRRHDDVIDVEKKHHCVIHKGNSQLQSRGSHRGVRDDAVVSCGRNLEGCEADGR